MNPAALGLILLAAVAHAVWNLAAKRAGAGGAVFVWLGSLTSSILYIPLGIIVINVTHASVGMWAVTALVSGVIHTVYFVLLQRGYTVGDVSVVYPLARGTGPMLTVVFAMILFAETPGTFGIIGAALVVGGVVVIGLSGRSGSPGARPILPSLTFGALTGVMIAGYTLWDAHAVTTLAVAPLALCWGSSVTEAVLLSPVGLRDPAKVRDVFRANKSNVLAVGVLSPLAYILVLIAMQLAPVALVAPGREVSVVFVTLAGWLYFKEPDPARRLTGAGVVLAGVAMLALA